MQFLSLLSLTDYIVMSMQLIHDYVSCVPKLRQFANSVLYVVGILSKGASVISTTCKKRKY